VLSEVRRRLAVLVAVPLIGLLAAACGEVREQTQWSGDRTHGVSAIAGDIEIRNALIVADENGGQATLMATFANRGPADELQRVVVNGGEAEPADGPLEIPARRFARLDADENRLDLQDIRTTPGLRTEVEFIFGAAPRATVSVLVLADEGLYADVLTR
jgi:hypothetical protein